MHIDERIFGFFIEILSYCALNKQQGYALFANLDELNLLNEVKDWFEIVLRRKFFSQNINQPKLIYFYFLDQNIVKHLDKVFEDLSYSDFEDYFDFCYKRILDTYNENNLELFSYINFFHLIGSLRYFKDDEQNMQKIVTVLYTIINCKKLHPLIKYSALQITIIINFKEANNSNIYRSFDYFEEEYLKQLSLLRDEPNFARYISFYSMYYYDNKFNSMQLINQKYFDRILLGDNIDFRYLHTFIPQIASHLIRLDVDKYENEEFHADFEEIFNISNSNQKNIHMIQNFREKITNIYGK